MGNEDKIFSEDFEDDKKKIQEPEKRVLVTSIKKEKIDVSEKVTRGLEKGNKRLLGIIGMIVIGVIGAGAYFGITEGLIGNSEPFDTRQCHYGIHSDIFWLRCITEEEYKASLITKEPEISVTPSEESQGGEPLRDITDSRDKVEVEKTKDILGHYMVTTNGDWYGDYVDFRKLPNKIDKTGTQKINFRCFNDDFLKTSTYFGTFRNVIENNMKVQVFINDKLVNEQSTDVNRALILEGSCLGT